MALERVEEDERRGSTRRCARCSRRPRRLPPHNPVGRLWRWLTSDPNQHRSGEAESAPVERVGQENDERARAATSRCSTFDDTAGIRARLRSAARSEITDLIAAGRRRHHDLDQGWTAPRFRYEPVAPGQLRGSVHALVTAAMTPSPAGCSESSSAPTPPSRSTTAVLDDIPPHAGRALLLRVHLALRSVALPGPSRGPALSGIRMRPRSARVRAAERAMAPPAVPLGRQATPASRGAPPDLSRSPRSRGAGRRRSRAQGRSSAAPVTCESAALHTRRSWRRR